MKSTRRDRWRNKQQTHEAEHGPDAAGADSCEGDRSNSDAAASSPDAASIAVEMVATGTPPTSLDAAPRPNDPSAPTRVASVSTVGPLRRAPAPNAREAPAVVPRERSGVATAACYVDFENLVFSVTGHRHGLSVSKIVRHLNRLGREANGAGWTATAVYANWDAIVTHHRHAQDDWAMLGWRTVAVPAREDYLSQRPVKNLVDFVMSLDILEDARDRHFDHFFIVSGDADFCEVAERLKRLRRRVTVVGLRPNLAFRLREAADDTIVWSADEITGDEPLPVASYRRLTQPAVPHGHQGEDPYQVLLRAVRLAERDQGVTPVAWRVVRDEYFLRMTAMTEVEADRFVRELDRAGFVTAVTRRGRDGGLQVFLSIPH